MSEEIEIRRAESVADYRACQEAQRRAWGITEDGYVVPVATMVGAQHHGGLVLGAFLANGEAVGLSFGFLGRVDGRLCLYSQLTGMVPGYQGKGIGLRLKQAQWEFAKAEGLELLAWAFDPLQAGNAHFNLEKLGASVGRFIENMYGLRSDALNAGVPTDRLIAEWATTSSVRSRPEPPSVWTLPRLIRSTVGPDGVRTAQGLEARVEERVVLLEIPEAIQTLRAQAPKVAERWTLAVREAFTKAFAAGYRAVGFLRPEEDGGRRYFYVLERA